MLGSEWGHSGDSFIMYTVYLHINESQTSSSLFHQQQLWCKTRPDLRGLGHSDTLEDWTSYRPINTQCSTGNNEGDSSERLWDSALVFMLLWGDHKKDVLFPATTTQTQSLLHSFIKRKIMWTTLYINQYCIFEVCQFSSIFSDWPQASEVEPCVASQLLLMKEWGARLGLINVQTHSIHDERAPTVPSLWP